MHWLLIVAILFGVPAKAQVTSLSGGHGLGNSVLNVGLPQGGAFPFINFIKVCAALRGNSAWGFPAVLSAKGYPTWAANSQPAGITCGLGIPTNSEYSGHWVITWTGQFGTGGVAGVSLTAAGTFTVVGGSGGCTTTFVTSCSNGIFLTGANGSVEFSPPSTALGFSLNFLTTGALSGITNIALYRKDQETQFNAGKLLNPDYVAMLNVLNPRVLRFLNWNNMNTSNRSRQAYDTADYISYVSAAYPPGAWGGTVSSSGGAGVAYSGSAAPDTPNAMTDGETYQGLITDANTNSAPTLNVGGRGNIPIVTTATTAMSASFMSANSLQTFVYSAILNEWLWQQGGLVQIVPISDQAKTCNEAGRDCWFQIPQLYDVTNAGLMATAVAANLNNSNKAYFEYSNELMGTFQFQQVGWANSVGTALGLPGTYEDMYGLQDRVLFAAIKSVMPSALGISADWLLATQATNINKRLGGVDLTLDVNGHYTTGIGGAGTGLAIATNYTANPNRPVDFVDYISTASYFRGPNVPFNDAGYTTLEAGKNITGITNANPGVVTIANHGYSAGDRVFLSSAIQGMTQLQSTWVTVAAPVTTNTFAISNVVSTIANVTITSASPGVMSALTLSAGDQFSLSAQAVVPGTTGSLPSGLTAGTLYCSVNPSGATTQIATVVTGSCDNTAINTSGSSVGTLTAAKMPLSDTTGYGAWTSGGTASRQLPCVNGGASCAYGLLNAADDFASGNATQKQTALNWLMNDVNNGTRNGLQDDGEIAKYLGTWWPGFMVGAGSPGGLYGKPLIQYEGAYDGIPMTGITAAKLGLAVKYPNEFFALVQGYKNSSQIINSIAVMNNTFMSFSGAKYPAWFIDVYEPTTSTPSQWSMFPGDLYTPPLFPGQPFGTPYMSFNGMANFNAAP